MADVKLTALTELTAPTHDDMLYVVDSPGGSPASKKVSVGALAYRYMDVPLVDPTTQTWSWVNQGTSSVTETNNRCCILPQAGAAGYNQRIRIKTAPTPPYTVTALVGYVGFNGTAPSCGLLFRESSSGKQHNFSLYFVSSNRYVYSRKMNSATSYASDYGSGLISIGNPCWMRLEDNNTSRILSLSPDGYNWIAWTTIGRTDFLTADQVGFFADPYDNGYLHPHVSLLSWAEG